MARQIHIEAGEAKVIATLDGSSTAEAVWAALPLSAAAHRWGEEIYFSIPVSLEEAPEARAEVAVGELAYWPPGQAFCLFFGPTPASRGAAPRAASPVNVFGCVVEGIEALRSVVEGDRVRVTRAE